MACLAATGKEEKKAGGLVYAVALDPPDPGRLLYDGGDEGLDPVRSAFSGKGLRTLVSLMSGLRKTIFTSTLSRAPEMASRVSSASSFGSDVRRCWSACTTPLKKEVSFLGKARRVRS